MGATTMANRAASASGTCPGCGVSLPPVEGPVHRYMESSPACWARYGELLARDYADPAYRAAHRLVVDTYAVQHPGRPSPQSIQSVAVHLISLYAILEQGWTFGRATELLGVAAARGEYAWLPPPAGPSSLTLLHALAGTSAAAHAAAVREWAEAAWRDWGMHHAQVRDWARRAGA